MLICMDQNEHDLIGEIRAEMGRQGVTRSRLAEVSEIVPSTLGRRLSGHSTMTLPELLLICDALGVSLATLAARAESTPEGRSSDTGAGNAA